MKNIVTILGATIIASFLATGCGQNSNKQKELELKERELALKEKELLIKEKEISNIKTHSSDTIKNNIQETKTAPSVKSNIPADTKVLSANNTSLVKTLSDQEYGKYSFDLPALRFYSIMIHFIRGGNNVTLTDITPPPDGEKYIENKENGTFVIDKVNSEFKYVTCKFKKEGIYKLKYSIKKKKWILLNQQDLMGNKIEIESY